MRRGEKMAFGRGKSNIAVKELALPRSDSFGRRVRTDFNRNKEIYLLLIPVVTFYILFKYTPMYGAIIAFKDYSPRIGIIDSPWVGFEHFIDFFTSRSFWRVLKNTVIISLSSLVICFPAPIIFAILMNELKSKLFTRTVQTITYLPHFISLVVICGLLQTFTMDKGFINDMIVAFGGERSTLLNNPGLFVPIYVISELWQTIGWGSIIYLAALTGVDQELYEAAMIDGAGRWKQTLHVTIPGIMPTIVIMLVLKIGNILNVGYEKIILLYNPLTYDTADVISSFVYRQGLLNQDWSFSTAVGLFNSMINFGLLLFANSMSHRLTGSGLW